MKEVMDWGQLTSLLNNAEAPKDEKGWNIYRFLHTYIGEALPSSNARWLLSEYIKLDTPKPSLLHSLMLSVALKMADAYPEFKLGKFLSGWGIDNLRKEDYEQQKGADGRVFSALADKMARTVLRKSINADDDAFDDATLSLAKYTGERLGFLPQTYMVAVKMHEGERNGKKIRMVKLVSPDGMEILADWHTFHAKPWEIVGRMYSVLPRKSADSGNVRVDTLAPAKIDMAEVFGKTIGYVDSYDDKHKHYHIYDNQSRHFVAESPNIRIKKGDFVWFCPVVPTDDKFKSAIPLNVVERINGAEAFGITDAKVTYINDEKQYFAYETATGEKAFANLSLLSAPVIKGMDLKLITYLRRGKDGEKRLYVACVL